ncbi:MAG TPA: MMPL family transporter, partial [Nakamurella sp.]
MLRTLGRGIARHPGWIVLAWLVVAVASFAAATGAFGEGLFARLSSGQLTVPSESDDGLAILTGATSTGPTLTLIVQGVDPTDTDLVEPVGQAHEDLLDIAGVASVAEPITAPGGPEGTAPAQPGQAPAASSGSQVAQLVAKDGDGFLVVVTLE